MTPMHNEITVSTLGHGVGKRMLSYSHQWKRGALLVLLHRAIFRYGEDLMNFMDGWQVKEPTGDIGFLPDGYAGMCEVVVDA